ncbi:S-layer homology domain-containing protein [Paenibacillus lautus]|uniref:Ig-like domain-containing protein n=1 Tax=Paenibacillus lautus TaxID=1401 RepID=UPI00203EC5BB|nr:S-layer homology domain-containing protein [Paenibacillus lautus]MCM3261514.1 S-layer homology domain-containing protein [Paenibacillus lautus]
MSDKSYQIKENNQVMIQGGEKKVMKKILSVALSTAMAFSMFASVAFGDDALNTQQKFDVLKEKGIFTGYPDGTAGLDKEMTRAEFAKVLVGIMGLEPIEGKASFKDKNYKADKWPAPYVEAVYAAGLMEGKNTTKMIFDFNGKITVQEMAKVLVTAQKLEIPTETNNNASDWAKGYVQAAINAGLVDAKANPKANASRSQLVDVAYSIYLAQQKPAVASYKVSENGKVVEFTLANNEVVKVTLETALVPNKDTEVKFTHNNYDYTETVKWVVTEASKVQGVAADNLKEVVVTFDGEVDKATAELKDNYTLSGSLKVKTASLNDAKNAVVLTLENAAVNQQKYTISVNGVKAGTKTIEAKDIEFAPVDVKLPEVTSVASLGTKAVKIVFSEPVANAQTGSFLLDGKAFYGNPSTNGREVVLKPYDSSALTVGEHTLTVSGVEDFAKFKSLKSEHKFTVVEDTVAPTMTDITATLEKVTVTFSEDVDPDTIETANVYHKRGSSNITADRAVQVSGNKYDFYFPGDKDKQLPSYETTFYVEKVKDYSGNQITETSKTVRAGIDYERPYVVDLKIAETKDAFTVTFSKDIASNQEFTKFVKVTDKDGKTVQVKSAYRSSSDHNKLVVEFYGVLPKGDNKVEILGVKDNTLLGNVMTEYSKTVNVADVSSPSVESASFNLSDSLRRAVIVFDKKMDPATLSNKANFVLLVDNGNGGVRQLSTPDSATLTPIQDSKAVMIDLPETVSGINIAQKLKGIMVLGVKDTSGNYLSDYSVPVYVDQYTNVSVVKEDNYDGKLAAKKQITLKLNQAVSGSVNKDTVTVTNANGAVVINSVTTNNSNTITINLADELYDVNGLSVNFKNTTFNGVAGGTVTLGATDTTNVTGATYTDFNDKVAPEVAPNQNTYPSATATGSTYTVTIDFTENLKALDSNLLAQDLVVTRLSDNKVLKVQSSAAAGDPFYSVAVNANKQLIVTINDAAAAGTISNKYSIAIVSGAKYIQDDFNNVVAAKDAVRTR